VEIRDGLLIMREWITPATHDRIVETLSAENLTARDAEAAATACWLKAALDAKARGLDRVTRPLDLVRQGGVDQETELKWLTTVAKAWASPRINSLSGVFEAGMEPQKR
jgi:LDH2 family malate/lactate/ureidoglycolate dehydrogenase